MVPTQLRELAERVVGCYDDLDAMSMALIAGSAARGLADDASDLDVYLHFGEVDRATLEATARLEPLGARRIVGADRAAGYFEKYALDGRFVDVECISTVVLEVADEALTSGEATDQVLALAGALRDAVAVRGSDELARWQARLTYTDELARHQVRARGLRLLRPSALHRLTYARGDTLSFEARVSAVLLDLVGLLGAVNRTFLPLAEPKWLTWHLARLGHQPPELLARIDAGLTRPDAATMADLDRLAQEVLDLVDEHVPEATTAPARFVLDLDPTRPPI